MPRPYSYKRLHRFNLLQLPTDCHGQPGGKDYSPLLITQEMRAVLSLRADDPGVWSGRRHALASRGEYEVFRVLEGNPWVIDIREQYPLASPDVIQALLRGEEVPRNRVMTLDFVVTLAPRTLGGPLHYLALSHKPDGSKAGRKTQARSERELRRVGQVGWSWDYIGRPKKEYAVRNHEALQGWCTSRGLDEVWGEARDLSVLMYRTTSTKTLRGQLDMLARRLHISVEHQWFVLAAAYYLGFIAFDHDFVLDEDARPVLVEAPYGWR